MRSDNNPLLERLSQATRAPLGEAKSLPFSSYHDQSVYKLEKERIFHSDWVFVCAENELANPGDYFAFFLADEPIVILRGKDEQLRAMSNVCRHRGTLLIGSVMGNSTKIGCPYHAWTYDDTGALLGAPHTRKDEINKRNHCLPQFLIEIWNGLVFINLNTQVTPIASRLSGINNYLNAFDIGRFTRAYSGEIEYWDTNWKLALENAMESYHLFKVHRETLEKVTPTEQAFYLQGCADWTLTAGKMEGVSNKFVDWIMGSNKKIYEHYILISIPPSFVGILTYESLDWISVLPNGEKQCVVRAAGINETGSSGNKDERDFVKAFFSEDKQICERVQTGMSAQYSEGGKLVELERIVVDFHHYLAKHLFSFETKEPYKSSQADQFFSERND